MPRCHVLEELGLSSLTSARRGTLHPHFAVENRGKISWSHITLKLSFKSQTPSVMMTAHKGLDTELSEAYQLQ